MEMCRVKLVDTCKGSHRLLLRGEASLNDLEHATSTKSSSLRGNEARITGADSTCLRNELLDGLQQQSSWQEARQASPTTLLTALCLLVSCWRRELSVWDFLRFGRHQTPMGLSISLILSQIRWKRRSTSRPSPRFPGQIPQLAPLRSNHV